VLEDVGADDDVEAALPQRRGEVEGVEVPDDHPLAAVAGRLRRLGVPLDAHHRAAEDVAQHPGHVAGGAAQLQHALALADQAEDARVGVVPGEVDPRVVAAGHQGCTVISTGSPTLPWTAFPPAGGRTS